MKKYLAAMLAGVFVFSMTINAFADGELTKGEYAQILLETADVYNPSIGINDIIKGDGSSDTSERFVTKVEALVMLRRAFGNLPTLNGDLARTAPESGTYTDVPVWAQEDISKLSQAGVLSEEPGGELGAGDYITQEYADIMSGRMYRLFGSNPKDDFYAAVNHRFLVSSSISAGYDNRSVFTDITAQIGYDLSEILVDVLSENHQNGSIEQKVKDFYLTAADKATREKLGITPIEPYLKQLRDAKNDKELQQFALDLAEDTTLDILAGFSVTTALEDKNKYVPTFDIYYPTLTLEDYNEGSKSLEEFRKYMVTVFKLGGNDEETAQAKADSVIEFEKELAKHSKSAEDYAEIENSYNYYTLKQLQGYYKSIDLQAIADVHGFKLSDEIVVSDPEAMKFYGSYFDGEHTELLKNLAEISMLAFYSDLLTEDFIEADNQLVKAVYGYDPENDIASDAFNSTVSLMDEYLGMIYYEQNFTQGDKARVETIVNNIIEVYRNRLNSLDWLSDETKNQAIKKLDNMDVIIGMPETSSGFMDNITIKSKSSGGTYIENIYSVLKENDRVVADLLSGNAAIEDISFSAYTVNAMYIPDKNAIILPAGILREPLFDPEASDAENYGTIGYIVGHEISHAFDTNGAKYDENGNYKNWWTDEDYANFEQLSKKAELYYDGAEAATGLTVNGKLTLDENIADIAGLEAALDALKMAEAEPDYKAFFERFAASFRYTTYRDTLEYDLAEDVHSPSSIRVNYSAKSTDEFYEAYDIQPGDGMYVPEEDRIRIW